MAHQQKYQSILIQNINIIDTENSSTNSVKNLLIENGIINKVSEEAINKEVDLVIDGTGKYISSGWVDLGTSLNEPGFEHKDDIESLTEAALFGGFTELVTLPNSNPVVQTKESIRYLKSIKSEKSVNIIPMASLTQDAEGKSISEMMDLDSAGAVAFSDGRDSNIPSDVLKKALLYLQSIDGLLIYYPDNKKMYSNGQMHEGKESTMLGMRGIPAMAEHTAIQNAISILKYTGGKIHFANISTGESAKLIRQAKSEGLKVTCDVSANHLIFTDEDLKDFDTNYKVKPPFRTKNDIKILWEGLSDGTIDAIVSSHSPQDQESKLLEFNLADFGILGLETLFSSLIANKPNEISLDLIIEKITNGPRQILGIHSENISEGKEANLTIFDIETEWEFEVKHIQSKSKNTPFVGRKLKGKPFNVIVGNCVSSFEQ